MRRIFLIIILCICNFSLLFSCTLWGCIGSSVVDGGLLISKNRDWKESSINTLRIFYPENGFKYLVIYALGEKGGVKGGINEKGLVVFSAKASSVKEENRLTKEKEKIRLMLTECKSVQDVLNNQERYLLGRSQFLLIGDNKELISVEISPDNRAHIERKTNGNLYHTNHYLHTDFLIFNEKPVKSSHTRYNRINELLKTKTPMRLEDMTTLSNDKNDGPNNSIWRDGSKEGGTRTLMNMSVYVPLNEFSKVYYKIANTMEPIKTGELILDTEFWKKEGPLELK